MEIIVIVLAAFATSLLTFFSGFGLGTVLTPVFAIFFPVDLAIALTGAVYFCNNLFKIVLIGKNAGKTVLVRFGIPAIIAAFIGAWLLLGLSALSPLYHYRAGLVNELPLVVSATLAAISGAFIGNRLLKKVTLYFVQKLVAVLLVIISLALGLGLI